MASPVASTRVARPAVPTRIFLVEDSKPIRDLLRDAVDAMDRCHIVDCASTEAEAIHWLEENPDAWDVAVIDLILDQGSGLGVLDKARRTAPRKAVAVFSAYVTPGMREHCLRAGASAVFQKDETRAFLDWLGGARR